MPIVLATIPMTRGLPAADRIFDVVFLLVIVFTLVQGPTLPALARRLGVTEGESTREVEIDAAPLEEMDVSLLQFDLPPKSRLSGVAIFEIGLPKESAVSMIVRDGHVFVPDGRTVLRSGDRLLLATSNPERATTERRLRAVSRAGRLAQWRGEFGDPVPSDPVHAAGTGQSVRPRPRRPISLSCSGWKRPSHSRS